jgi:hypothetical protein
MTLKNIQECYNDALYYRDESENTSSMVKFHTGAYPLLRLFSGTS